jgi:hypothetical protein
LNEEMLAAHIVVGSHVLDFGDPRGALVRKASRAEREHIRPRPVPILIRPRGTRGLLDRQSEVVSAFSALDADLPVELSGEPGIGKTAVIRQLTHHPRAASFVDGIVYLTARHHSALDLQQLMFEAFYETDEFYKPTLAEIQCRLQKKRALIVLDDVRLTQSDLETVIDSASRSAFVVAARNRCLWGEARSIALKGLPPEEAVLLLERAIDRSLDGTDRQDAMSLCAATGGHPLRLLQAAAILREREIPLDPWVRTVTPESLITELLATTDEKQRRALLALTAFPGVALPTPHIAGIAEVTDLEPSLLALLRRGLVTRCQSRHQLVDGVRDRLRRTEDLKPWLNRAVTYFTAWAERYRRSPDILLEESEALLRMQQCAADNRRWTEVLELGRLLEEPLILRSRWGAWAITLERCLAAAKASRDRSAEAWALHQLGSRALCLGDAVTARAMLNRAVELRDALEDRATAAVTRQNLCLVLPPVSEYSREHAVPAAGAGFDLGSLPLRAGVQAQVRIPKTKSLGTLFAAAVLLAIVGCLASWVLYTEGAWTLDGIASLVRRGLEEATGRPVTAPTLRAAAEPRAPQPRDATVVSLESEPEAAIDPPPMPSILIFTARPGSMTYGGPTNLCYAVSDASRARLEPHIGEIHPTPTLSCLRVAPRRTTTYELTAYGRDDHQVRQQLVIVVR